MLDSFGKTARQLPLREGLPCVDVDIDLLRLVEHTDKICSKRRVNGCLSADSGLTRALSQPVGGDNVLYAFPEDKPEMAGLVPLTGNMACSRFKLFPLGEELGYYTVEQDGVARYRSPYLAVTSGFETPLSASYAITDGSAVEACYHNIRLWHLDEEERILSDVADEDEALLAVILPESRVIFGNRAALEQIEPYAEQGFSVRFAGE